MANFQAVLNEIKTGTIQIAQNEGGGLIGRVQADGEAFANAMKADLQLWTQQVTSGALSKADFEFLVRGKRDLATMNALTEAGAAQATVDRVRSQLVNLVITAAFKAV